MHRSIVSISVSTLTLLSLVGLFAGGGCVTARLPTVPGPDFNQTTLRTIDIRFLDYTETAARGFIIGAGRKSRDLYEKYFRDLLKEALHRKGYYVADGADIHIQETLKINPWAWNSRDFAAYYRVNVEAVLKSLVLAEADAVFLFRITDRHNHSLDEGGYSHPFGRLSQASNESNTLAAVGTAYVLFDLRLQKAILTGTALRTQRKSEVLEVRKYGSVEIRDWRYTESERDVCERSVAALLQSLPNRAARELR